MFFFSRSLDEEENEYIRNEYIRINRFDEEDENEDGDEYEINKDCVPDNENMDIES